MTFALGSLFESDVSNAMPLQGENPITSYFYRVSPNARSKALPRSAKRAQSPGETDPATKGTSRKKLKSQKYKGHTALHVPSNSSRATLGQTGSAKDMIEIQDIDILPGSPYEAIYSHQSTPSSPLPDLTPSPSPEASQNFSRLFSSNGAVDDSELTPSCAALAEAGYLEPQEVDSDPIPSSQTQTMEYSYEDEDSKMSQKIALSSYSASVRSPRISNFNYIPSSQPDPEPFASQYQFVPSSQSQFMDPAPTSPIIPDFDTVPSSQSQELFYSQHIHNSPKKGPGTRYWSACLDRFPLLISLASSHKQTSLMDITTDESEIRAQSSGHLISGTSPGVYVEELHLPSATPNSQTPTCTSCLPSPKPEGEKESSVHDHWNDREDSYESLPDAVEHFRGMFGETFESLPPDFPQSLRF